MRKGFLISLVSLICAAGAASAQDVQVTPDLFKDQPKDQPVEQGPSPRIKPEPNTPFYQPPGNFQEGGFPEGACCEGGDPSSCCCSGSSRCWGSLEYLLWWVKDGPVPGPLVTTGRPSDGNLAGALGAPGTQVLFGGSPLDFQAFSGMRLTLGGWLTPESTIGIEVSGFMLEQRSDNFSAQSNANGNPPLYVPAFNVPKNREDSLIVSDPLQQFGGSVAWSSTSELWGAEVNAVFAGWSGCDFDLNFLAGMRYVDLLETLELQNTTVDLTNDSATSLVDRFETRNQFFGGQVGTRLDYRLGSWSLDLTGKLALGDTHETVIIEGRNTQTGAGGTSPTTTAGGFFAQKSNIGRQEQDEFSVIPELEVKVGYEFMHGLRAFIGYDIMYWNQVARPGAQIDRNLNLTQSNFLGSGTLTGPASPAPLFNHSDYFATGFTFGLEFRY